MAKGLMGELESLTRRFIAQESGLDRDAICAAEDLPPAVGPSYRLSRLFRLRSRLPLRPPATGLPLPFPSSDIHPSVSFSCRSGTPSSLSDYSRNHETLDKFRWNEWSELLLPAYEKRGSNCLEDTRSGLLNSFYTWSETTEALRNVFLVLGSTGSGKSCVATVIYNALKEVSASVYAIYSNINTPKDLARVRFLLTFSRIFSQHSSEYNQLIRKVDLKLDRQLDLILMDELFIRPFTILQEGGSMLARPFFFVIDGLDDCRDKDAALNIIDDIMKISGLSNWLKFVITSRPLPEIEEKASALEPSGIIRFNLDDLNTDEDIAIYTRVKLEALVKSRSLHRSWYREDVVERLARKASFSFIWISTAMEFLFCQQLDEREMVLLLADVDVEEPDAKLDSLYKLVLASAQEKLGAASSPLMRSLLHAIRTASKIGQSQLSMISLRDLTQNVNNESTTYTVDLQLLIDELRPILYQDPKNSDIIRVCHESFVNFLESREHCGDLWITTTQSTLVEGMENGEFDGGKIRPSYGKRFSSAFSQLMVSMTRPVRRLTHNVLKFIAPDRLTRHV